MGAVGNAGDTDESKAVFVLPADLGHGSVESSLDPFDNATHHLPFPFSEKAAPRWISQPRFYQHIGCLLSQSTLARRFHFPGADEGI